MSDILIRALAELNLQPGECRVVKANGHRFEISRPVEDEADLPIMVMRDPQLTLPDEQPTA